LDTAFPELCTGGETKSGAQVELTQSRLTSRVLATQALVPEDGYSSPTAFTAGVGAGLAAMAIS
jgi:hypothetical protein